MLRKEFYKASRAAKKHQTQTTLLLARESRLGYFKAIKKARANYWADFLTKTTPRNIWTVKQFVVPRQTLRFPALPNAYNPVAINKAHLHHFFLPKHPFSPMGRLFHHPSAIPLTKQEVALALSKSYPFSAPSPLASPIPCGRQSMPYTPAS